MPLLFGLAFALTIRRYDESIFAAEEQLQRKHLESNLRRKAAKLGYQLTPLLHTA